ncbi:hypothetical protein ACIF8Z_15810 [Pseudomonas promysalinigenes]|uniref:hypothetical protein n=1 Tax=Pseudomonas promysalinigenes TaxID=485898 RepID=UPI0037CA2D3C
MYFLDFFRLIKSNLSTTYKQRKSEGSSVFKKEQNGDTPKIPAPDFSNTHRSIMEIWNKVGVKLCAVEGGTIFYSGIRTVSPIVDADGLVKGRKNLWMSQSCSYAGEYCYRNPQQSVYFALLKLRLTHTSVFLEFPNKFHPADAFFEYAETDSGFEIDYSSPPKYHWFEHGQADHHVDLYFSEIVKNGNFKCDPIGHLRRAIKHELGAVPGEIKELFTSDLRAIEVVDWIVPPNTKLNYLNLIGANLENAADVLFPKRHQ